MNQQINMHSAPHMKRLILGLLKNLNWILEKVIFNYRICVSRVYMCLQAYTFIIVIIYAPNITLNIQSYPAHSKNRLFNVLQSLRKHATSEFSLS